MTPDDPRHGTQAGSVAHWKSGERPCFPCSEAARRASKAARIDRERGRPRTVTLGTHAHGVIVRVPADQLARSSGITVHKLGRLRAAGPDQTVHRSTRDRILRAGAASHWTVIGIQRRVRALVALGWSVRAISEHAVCDYESLKKLAREERRSFVCRSTAEAVLEVYATLLEPPPTSASSKRAAGTAARNEWAPPSAWLDIDDPDETPDPGWQPRRWNRHDLAAEWDFLLAAGESREAAAAQLGMTLEAVERSVFRARKESAA